MAAALWLQAPAMYARFVSYGQRRLLTEMLIATFGASIVFGPMLGAMADRYGRKLFAKVYCVMTIVACILMQYPTYSTLMASRVVTGMSSSLLFTCFEAWAVHEHLHRGYEPSLLGGLFASATFIGHGLMGIVSGAVLDIMLDAVELATPCQVAAVLAVVGFVSIRLTWEENCGGKLSSEHSVFGDLAYAAKLVFDDRRLLLLGSIALLYEGAIYVFTFHWVGMLSFNGQHVPYREVFICFMGAFMAGSTLAGKLMMRGRAPEQYLVWVMLASSLAVAVALVLHLFMKNGPSLSVDNDIEEKLQTIAFVVLQFTAGVFWPSMMKLRSHYLPEDNRATLISILRVPLNFVVCLIIYWALDIPIWGMFAMCTAMLLGAAACQRALFTSTREEDHRQHFMQC
eukprot:CAMPEP_0117650308 /NCGR_PEP_ID=MMETSP0804-20121206/1470_1 /TAXON_ID=1074897 /ORGANISM="Tetraselmis astigmatica, Strain CCMP880" /LENGTH=398 /DNA_ID=CAMNT_0005456171 /DNA_START=192 /DNA_END=1388 /DNA_ORIENTATION=-